MPEKSLPATLSLKGNVGRPKASEVKGVTASTIGGVAPLGMTARLPPVIDPSFKRFQAIEAAAGHPRCVFSITFVDFQRITEAITSRNIAEPLGGVTVDVPDLATAKTVNKDQDSRHTNEAK